METPVKDKYRVDKADIDSYLSLNKMLSGRKVVDVHGRVAHDNGNNLFQIRHIVLDDGSRILCEGEHDMPYLAYDDELEKVVEEIADEDDAEDFDDGESD